MAYILEVETLFDLSQASNVSRLTQFNLATTLKEGLRSRVLAWTHTCLQKIIPQPVLSLLTSSIWAHAVI